MRDVKRLEVFGLAVFAGLLVPTVLLGQLNLVEHISDSSATPLLTMGTPSATVKR